MFVKSTVGEWAVKKSKQNILTDTQRRKFQHEMANWAKHYGKQVFEKGPEWAEVNIAGNMIIVSMKGYLTKYEKFILKSEGKDNNSVKESRLQAAKGIIFDGSPKRYIEERLNVEVLGYVVEIVAEEEISFWIILLDTYLTL